MLEIFKEPFVQTALLGGLITACLCAYLGVFVILKRIVFVGIALSQVAALGVALGLFLGVNPVLSAFLLTLVGIILFWIPFTERNISREAFLGFIYAFCAATAIILIAKNPLAEARGLNLISGNLLYTNWLDLKILGIAFLFVLALHLFLFKEFIFVSFDRETAFTTGLRANVIDFLLYLSIGITISLSMKICGIVFVFASLIIPAMVGLVSAKRTGMIFLIACASSVACVAIGIYLSYIWDFPSGPTIVGLYSFLFLAIGGIRAILILRRG